MQDQSVTSTGFAGSITTLNFIGNGVTIEDTKVSAGAGIEVGVSTITINKANLNIQDSSGFTPVTGVTTVRVGSGLSFVEVPQVVPVFMYQSYCPRSPCTRESVREVNWVMDVADAVG